MQNVFCIERQMHDTLNTCR